MINKNALEELFTLMTETPDYKPPVEDIESGKIMLPDLNADTIAAEYEKRSKYKHKYHLNDLWSMYKDGMYQSVDGKEQVMRYISEFGCRCVVFNRKKKSYERFNVTKAKLAAILDQVAYLPDVGLWPSQAAPCSLDGDLNPEFIIPLQNGLLDWSVYPYKLHDHTPNYYTLNYLPYSWKGEIDSEMLIKYLIDICCGDVELFDMLQMWAGYCLGFRRGKKKFLLIQGEADTGKSVFADVLSAMLGEVNVSGVPLAQFNDPHLMTASYGKMLNISDESEEMLLDRAVENALKALTGGTMYQFKRLYQNPFLAYPTAKIMICTNHLPKFTDTSEGIWTRMLLMPLKKVFVGDEIDPFLAQKIIENEMGGVLKWALEGARKLKQNGQKFYVPDASREALGEYRREVNPEIEFLEDNFLECDVENTQLAVPCKVFRQAYEEWCKGRGIGARGDKRLKKMMEKVFPNHRRDRVRRGDKRPYHYLGVMMSTDSEFYLEGNLT